MGCCVLGQVETQAVLRISLFREHFCSYGSPKARIQFAFPNLKHCRRLMSVVLLSANSFSVHTQEYSELFLWDSAGMNRMRWILDHMLGVLVVYEHQYVRLLQYHKFKEAYHRVLLMCLVPIPHCWCIIVTDV